MSAAKIQKAKIDLLLSQPFFGALVMHLRFIESTEIKTMATDGDRLLWNADFVKKLTEAETATVLAHEAYHCALLHHLRCGSRDAKRWNIATDHAINLHLEDCNIAARSAGRRDPFPWPKCGAFKDPAYAGKSAEEIYDSLPIDPPGGNGGSEGMGEVIQQPADQAVNGQQAAQWKIAVKQAEMQSRGTLPASIKREIGSLLNPPQRWQDILREFIRERSADDYSWTKPNRRYLASGFILPSLHSEKLGRIAIAIDTSGSIDKRMLDLFFTELEGVISEARPEAITLIDCDARINSVLGIDPRDPLPRDFKGGGGTDFCPVFELLEKDPPIALIYFTDLDGSFPEECSFPVLWAAYNSGSAKPPFGTLIKL